MIYTILKENAHKYQELSRKTVLSSKEEEKVVKKAKKIIELA